MSNGSEYIKFLQEEKKGLDLTLRWDNPEITNIDYRIEKETINFDTERINDILSGNGFIVLPPAKTLKKDLKRPDGIFSSRFGQTLGDVNSMMHRYRCMCGATQSRLAHNTKCDKCGTYVQFVDDNYNYFGWLVLVDPYIYIHPSLYKQIERVLGRGKDKRNRLENIIDYKSEISRDGYIIDNEIEVKNEPWYGIGMLEFYKHFDEIMLYYIKKNPKQQMYYDDIMANREKVFTHSIPVFTTLLRGVDVKDGSMYYEKVNGIYRILNRLVATVNNNKTRFNRYIKMKNQTLYKIQMKVLELYEELEQIISGKKGNIRMLVGARYSFSTRAVIVQNPTLKTDQITLPYISLCILLRQRIINILVREYNISDSLAYNIWSKAQYTQDPNISRIIMSIINSYPYGLPVMIDRPPTIVYGSQMQMFVVGMTYTFTIGVPLRILEPMNADFDGDEFNVFMIINDAFFEHAFRVFNPRNAMYISRNDGYFNIQLCIRRDTVINSNAFMHLGRSNYNPQQLEKINWVLRNKVKI